MILTKLYAWAVRSFPRDVVDEHGAEMCDAFAALLRTRHAERGALSALHLALRAVADAVGEGLRERARRRRERGVTTMGMIDDLVTDLRLTLRGFVRTPWQAAVLVLTLALGVGATSAIFSVLHAVLLAPLPYPDPGELIAVRHLPTAVAEAGPNGPGGPDILDYAEVPSISAIGGVQTLETNLNDDEGAARVTMGWITPDFFEVLGVDAELGRVLRPDDWAGADRARMEDPNFTPPPMAVVLGHGLWTTRFARDPDVLGRTLALNGQSMQVVGVLRPGFRLMLPAEAAVAPEVDAMALMPVPMTGMSRGVSGLDVVARLADGVTVGQARQELERVAARLRADHEQHARLGTEVLVDPLHDLVVVEARGVLWMLFGAVGLLLLIAATNVANLLLVRATAREREFAVRAALGAGRSRVVRQLLTESVVVGLLGTGVGLLLARAGIGVLASTRPGELPRMEAIAMNAPVLAFSVAVSVTVTLLFGLVPAFTSARAGGRSATALRASGAGARASVRVRRAMIVGELAVSVVLLAGAGLLFRSYAELRRVDPGIEPGGVVAIDAAVPFFPYRDDAVRAGFFAELRRRTAELPGVEAAGIVAALPLERSSGGTWLGGFEPSGDAIDPERSPRARYRPISAGGLEALGIRLREGRALTSADEEPGSPVPVVVDAHLADDVWPEGALGRTLQMAIAGYTGQPRTLTGRVVGVTEPARFLTVRDPDPPTIFVPYPLYTPVDGTVVLRARADAEALLGEVRRIVAELDAAVPVFGARTLEGVVRQATAQSRYALLLLGVFGAAALLLAAVGLYGVVSTLAQQRTREIGVRLALGARGADISGMVARDGLGVIAGGLLLGLAAAALLGPAARGLLYQVEPLDPTTLVSSALLLAGVCWLASLLPARRAARLDPVRALRAE